MPRELALVVLALVCLIGDFLLVVLGHDLPPMLESVTLATVGAAAGATIPRSSTGGLR